MLKDGRIAWPVFFAVLFSALTILATDLTWRLVEAPILNVAVIGLVVLAAGNLAIYLIDRRAR